MEVPGIPQSIPIRQMGAMIRSLGIAPEEVITLTFSECGIEAKVFALDDQGNRYYNPGSDVPATHVLSIRVTP